MQFLVGELSGPALAYAFALAQNWEPFVNSRVLTSKDAHGKDVKKTHYFLSCRTREFNDLSWANVGPVLDKEKISTTWNELNGDGRWMAITPSLRYQTDKSRLIASVRCHVQDKLGDVIEIPDQLL